MTVKIRPAAGCDAAIGAFWVQNAGPHKFHETLWTRSELQAFVAEAARVLKEGNHAETDERAKSTT